VGDRRLRWLSLTRSAGRAAAPRSIRSHFLAAVRAVIALPFCATCIAHVVPWFSARFTLRSRLTLLMLARLRDRLLPVLSVVLLLGGSSGLGECRRGDGERGRYGNELHWNSPDKSIDAGSCRVVRTLAEGVDRSQG
jgi:hypothetical protein